MQIVIPMAGRGDRFLAAGHTAIKPLIDIDGLPMIARVVALFPGETNFLFICAQDHLDTTPLREVLAALVPTGRVVGITPHKLGPVHSALAAEQHIAADEPVMLNYCDFGVGWDYADFKRLLVERDPAGALTAYRGFHPHSLGPNLYAYLRAAGDRMLEIKEKGCFTNDRMQEFASAGLYYFRNGALLKHYFQRAKAANLKTQGEYYASSPYNLIAADGLPVLIYEVRHFLQWGTPEDLSEYLGWSRFFTQPQWTPSASPSAGAVLVPMAGAGERFRRAGYAEPKPLVPVAGRPMVQRALATLPPAARTLVVAQAAHLAHPALRPALAAATTRPVELLAAPGPTAGQAATCLLARDALDLDAPLFIGPCDSSFVYAEADWAALTADPQADAAVWTFRDHAHANRYPEQYGWVQADAAGWIAGISVKQPLHADVRADPGVTGAFWFRRARLFFEAADALVAQNHRVNGEFYVDAVIPVLLQQGRRARLFDVTHYLCFGTPDDVRTYEYWDAYFRSHPRRPHPVDAAPAPAHA
ncbi:MAG: NTP transferase domain-containing protein [Anaerolineales bacterium]|nr:NTP transferase domain-containing protein [Anaerolineales bacterium]